MRMQKHITLLGALFIAYHALGLIVGFVLMSFLSAVGCLTGDPVAMSILSSVGVFIGTFLIVVSIPGIIAGIFLLLRRPWARIMTLIVGALNLIDIPLGTALGIYSFWVLLHDETIAVFEAEKAKTTRATSGDSV